MNRVNSVDSRPSGSSGAGGVQCTSISTAGDVPMDTRPSGSAVAGEGQSTSISTAGDVPIKVFLEGELPHQSAVYVVMNRDKKEIHVYSIKVGGRYTISNALIRTSNDNKELKEANKYIKAKCAELETVQLYDKAGFYMGVKALDLEMFDDVTTQQRTTDYAFIDSLIVFRTYQLDAQHVRNILGDVPVLENLTFGDVEYMPDHNSMDKLHVSVNERVLPDHIIFKIDQPAYLMETEFSDGYLLLETELSAQWSDNQIDLVSTHAVELIKSLLSLPSEPWERPDNTMKDVITESTNPMSPWPVSTYVLRQVL